MTEQGPTQIGLIEPTIDLDSAVWWDGLAEGQILLQACEACGRARFPRIPSCPYCGAARSQDRRASGGGRIYSWTVVHRALHPVYADDVPYTIVAVDLDEGPRIFGRYVGNANRLESGLAVKAHWYSVNGRTLLGFEAG